jgi:hypothetical protein
MVTQKGIAQRWGVSCVRVHQLVKKGCPTTSYAAADKWREAHPPKQIAVNKKVPAQKGKAPTKTAKAPTKPSRINPRAAEKSRKATTKPVGRSKGPPEPEKPALPPIPVESGDSLLDGLNAAIHAHKVSHILFDHACRMDSHMISARLSEHTRALTARFTAEESYRKEMQIRGVLVDKGIVFQSARQAIEAVLKRLRRLPIEVGPQCNPQESLRATKILQKAVDEIALVGNKEINAIRAARLERRGK